jgi:ketosteroid isomerase-like protein
MKKLFCLFAFLLASALPGLAQTGEDALLKADRDFNQATQEKRLEGWMAFMADDVVLLRGKTVVGKEAARADLKEQWDDLSTSLTWEPKRAQLFNSGRMGYTSGRWVYKGKNAEGKMITRTGDYLTVWSKQADGSWKVIYDGGTSDPQPKS